MSLAVLFVLDLSHLYKPLSKQKADFALDG